MAERNTRIEEIAYIGVPLTNLEAAEKGKRAFIDAATGKATITASSSTVDIGVFDESRTGDGSTEVVIRLHSFTIARRWDNDGVAPLAATDVGRIAYIKDSSTVSKASTGGRQRAGLVLKVTSLGVSVASLLDAPMASPAGATLAFVSNDAVLADYPRPGSIFDVPTTGAASTVTLPANAFECTEITFVADGTKNGHTVTYRDATGPTNLTAALTASKRHHVRAAFLNGKWACLSTVAP